MSDMDISDRTGGACSRAAQAHVAQRVAVDYPTRGMRGRRDRSDNHVAMANHVIAAPLRSPQVNGSSTVVPVGHQLVTRARELAPLLRECAAETEMAGDITASNVSALREAGMFSFFTPEAFTGREVDVQVAVRAFVELGRGCGASAWVAMILSGGSLIGALLDDDVRNEVWAESPTAAIGGVTATSGTGDRAPGGWVVSGRWQPASGIRHAQWAVLGVLLQREDGEVETALALMPIDDVRIVPTWSVAGMRGHRQRDGRIRVSRTRSHHHDLRWIHDRQKKTQP